MKLNLNLILLGAIVVISCGMEGQQSASSKSLVLVNGGDMNRTELSELITRVSQCKPKVIGINFVFEDADASGVDTLLSNAIMRAGNVVLVALSGEGDEVISSDSLFTNTALAQGLLYYGFDDERVTKQKMYISKGDNLLWSFPTTLASYYDIEHSDEIMTGAIGNEYYKIEYGADDQFDLLLEPSKGFDSSILSGKIVIIGYLGPNKQDMYSISSGKMAYSSWILANCTRNIVDRNFSRAE